MSTKPKSEARQRELNKRLRREARTYKHRQRWAGAALMYCPPKQ